MFDDYQIWIESISKFNKHAEIQRWMSGKNVKNKKKIKNEKCIIHF